MPWGTPDEILPHLEVLPFKTVRCFLSRGRLEKGESGEGGDWRRGF